jgi:hypothetical protein
MDMMNRFYQRLVDITSNERYFYSDFDITLGKQFGPNPDPIEVRCNFQDLVKLCEDIESEGFTGIIELDPRRALFGVRFVTHVGDKTLRGPAPDPDEIVKVFCSVRNIHLIIQSLKLSYPDVVEEFNTLFSSEGEPFFSKLALRWRT